MQESPSNGGFDARTNSSVSTTSTMSQAALVTVGTGVPQPDGPFARHDPPDDPLFELMIPDVEVCNDTGPRSAPAPEDFPIGSFVRLASVLVCRDILGDAMPDWWQHLIVEGVDLRIERHCDEFALVSGAASAKAWGLEPVQDNEAEDVVEFRVMVHRACMLAPRISHGNSSRYQTPTAMRTQPSDAVFAASCAPNLSVTLNPADVDLKLAVEQGNIKLKEGNSLAAIEFYTAAIQLAESHQAHIGSKHHIRALSNRSAAYFKLWEFDKALLDGERCAALDRNSIVGYIRAGTASRGKKQFEVAENWFRNALRVDATHHGSANQSKIQEYINANAIAHSLHDTVLRFAKMIDVSVDPGRINVLAKKKFEPKERIFSESPWVSVPVEPPTAVINACSHCHMQLWDRDAVSAALNGAADLSPAAKSQAAQMLSAFTGCQKQIECRHKCGARYCGKRCADLAFDEYHWAECGAAGKWKPCINFVDRLMTAESTFAKVLSPPVVRLALRVLAVFSVKNGDQTGDVAINFLHRMLTRRTGLLFSELPSNQVEIINRVRDALVPHVPPALATLLTKEAILLTITEHVIHCDTRFSVSCLHRAHETVEMHRGWLNDGPPAESATATLAELDAAYKAAIDKHQVKCVGLFRIIGCVQIAGEHQAYSFSELDTTSLGASMLRAASPVIPTQSDHEASGSSNSGRAGNTYLHTQTASSMHGIHVTASCSISRHQTLVLGEGPSVTFAAGTSPRSGKSSKRTSTSSASRQRKSSSPSENLRIGLVPGPAVGPSQ